MVDIRLKLAPRECRKKRQCAIIFISSSFFLYIRCICGMDVIQTSIERSPSGFHLRCKLCNNLLPLSATFCGTCGGRVTDGSADPSEHDRAPEEHVEQTDGGEMTVALHPRKVRQALEQQAKLITRP